MLLLFEELGYQPVHNHAYTPLRLQGASILKAAQNRSQLTQPDKAEHKHVDVFGKPRAALGLQKTLVLLSMLSWQGQTEAQIHMCAERSSESVKGSKNMTERQTKATEIVPGIASITADATRSSRRVKDAL